MKIYVNRKKTITELDDIECDVCHSKFKADRIKFIGPNTIDNIISIKHNVGYWNIAFEDGDSIELDICIKCFKKKLGKFIKIT